MRQEDSGSCLPHCQKSNNRLRANATDAQINWRNTKAYFQETRTAGNIIRAPKWPQIAWFLAFDLISQA